MKFYLLLFTILVLIFLYYGYPLYKATQLAKEIEAQTIPYEQNIRQDAVNILVAGDSTVFGVGADDPKKSTPGLIGAKYPKANIENISKSGLRLEGLESKIGDIDKTYELIVIQIGANDVVRFTSLEKVEEKLDSILYITTSRAKKVIVLTAGNIGSAPVFKAPLSNLITHRTKQVRDIFIKKVAAYPTAIYVDLYQEKENDVFLTDPEEYYAKDLFHPSNEGYAVWFEEIEKVLP